MGLVARARKILAGNTLIAQAIQSQNYMAGLLGWKISANGNAEFNNIVARGTVNVGSPTTGELVITPTVPAEIVAYYSGIFVSIGQFAIQLFPDSSDYYYMAVCVGAGGQVVFVKGWYFAATGKIYEESQTYWDPTIPEFVMNQGAVDAPTGTAWYQRSYTYGQVLSPGHPNAGWLAVSTDWQLGFSTSDPGTATVNTPATFNNTVTANQPVAVDATLDVTGISTFHNSVNAGAHSITTTGTVNAGTVDAGNITAGNVGITPTALNTPKTVAVTWPAMTGSNFMAVVTAHTGVPQNVSVGIGAVTSTGMNVTLVRSDSLTATSIDYIVISS